MSILKLTSQRLSMMVTLLTGGCWRKCKGLSFLLLHIALSCWAFGISFIYFITGSCFFVLMVNVLSAIFLLSFSVSLKIKVLFFYSCLVLYLMKKKSSFFMLIRKLKFLFALN